MGGKSWALLFDVLKYRKDPNFYAVYVRKTLKQLERTLWKEALKMWKPFLYYTSGPKKGKLREGAKILGKPSYKITFPTDPETGLQGATVEFTYADNYNQVEHDFQGLEISALYFDE